MIDMLELKKKDRHVLNILGKYEMKTREIE